MDGDAQPRAKHVGAQAILRTAHVPADAPDLLPRLACEMGPGPFALIALFASPRCDFAALMEGAKEMWGDCQVIGCTTAGEIAPSVGYVEDSVVAIGLTADHFHTEVLLFEDLATLNEQELIRQTIRARTRLGETAPHFEQEFAWLLVDGLSMSEDHLVSALSPGLGPLQLFGGSSGDGIRFEHSMIGFDGQVLERAAVLALVRTSCDVKVFSLNHFKPTSQRMVVTRADPKRRIVHEINAEPAARELGRVLGKNPEDIDTFTFAESPMVVRFGGKHHVRAIKRVTEDGDLEFFSAIDEGLVLTIAEAAPIGAHLRDELSTLSSRERPAAIIACDCVLRRIEAEQKQCTRDLSAVLAEYNVTGFSTYGEQVGGLHVNQTMTGVALYAPRGIKAV